MPAERGGERRKEKGTEISGGLFSNLKKEGGEFCDPRIPRGVNTHLGHWEKKKKEKRTEAERKGPYLIQKKKKKKKSLGLKTWKKELFEGNAPLKKRKACLRGGGGGEGRKS